MARAQQVFLALTRALCRRGRSRSLAAAGGGSLLAVGLLRMKILAVRAAVLAAVAAVCPRPAAAEDSRPMMAPDRPVHCLEDNEGNRWRLQCDDETRVCLYAPDAELDTRGNRTKPLERARECASFDDPAFDRAALEASGYSMVPGRADAPHGWTRDERGRVFQINFDLRRRLYIGGSYAPKKLIGAELDGGRSSIELGLLVYERFGGVKNPNRHRLRVFEGEVFLEPFSGELTLLHYDVSRRFLDPLLRITTFFGPPQRHDLHLNLGLWSEVGHLEVHHTAAGDSNLWRFGAVQATLDLWQSPRLRSFARLRSGIGIERLYSDVIPNRTAITASSALELDAVLDPRGFHNVRAELVYEAPNYPTPHPSAGERARRMRARAEYEMILLAINDQPLSLRLGAGAEKRNDIPGLPNDWAFVADAGLRFSLWAPPRPPE